MVIADTHQGDRYEGTAAGQHTAGDRDRRTHRPDRGDVAGHGRAGGIRAPPIFSDDFANLNNWTATRITLDNAIGSPSAPERPGGGHGPVRLCLPRSSARPRRALHEREREPGRRQQRRPVPPAHRRERRHHQGVRGVQRHAADPLGLRRHLASTPAWRWAPAGTTWSSAARSGRHDLEPLPRRRADRDQLGRRHRDDAGRTHPDRRHRRQDVHGQLRPRRPGHRAGRRRDRRHRPLRPSRAGPPATAPRPVRSRSRGPLRPTRRLRRSRSRTASTATAARPRSDRRPPRRSPTRAWSPARATPTRSMRSTRRTTPAPRARHRCRSR